MEIDSGDSYRANYMLVGVLFFWSELKILYDGSAQVSSFLNPQHRPFPGAGLSTAEATSLRRNKARYGLGGHLLTYARNCIFADSITSTEGNHTTCDIHLVTTRF